MTSAIVAGVGMNKFVKPGQHQPYRVMGADAIKAAVKDAGIDPKLIQQAYAGYIYGDTGSGQHAMYEAFQTGIPVFNVNNACCSGSTALYLARQAVESGQQQCVMAFGFEEMQPGALSSPWTDREFVGDRISHKMDEWGYPNSYFAPRWFGAAGQQYMETFDASPELFGKVAVKSRTHAMANPNAVFRSPLTLDEVMSAPKIYGDYMTRFMACPPTCGAAAAIIVSEAFARKHGISKGVSILAQTMATDTEQSWSDAMNATGKEMVRRAAKQTYEQTGLGPEDVDVIELHDCFTPNEVLSYENLGLCDDGGATQLVEDGNNTYGGKWVVNPSGGLMSKGHPIGATGLAQCAELVWQLRGDAGQRQVPGARVALQHNIGLVAGAVVTLYGI
ncbi:thiolase C-terminal domain-containing protein [Pseudomaricurvus alkylphenolicus]|uniref:thiolase C-terminal domain-containing protein n=1 Tax=Pseudomaricurvus alkylphenolicus TaxID=1306991 RepID=UPI00197D34C3|nr:lipid-transfer protein [Pseudomaricurvus alkylphenolicus]